MAYGDLDYGDGRYKGVGGESGLGEFSDQPIPDLFTDSNRCCLILGLSENLGGIPQEQGGGWSERSGDNWIWPSSTASIMHLFDQYRKLYDVALDARDGLFWVLNPIDCDEMSVPYLDKVDRLIEDSGEIIEGDIYPGEISGELSSFTVQDLETQLLFRPIDKTRCDSDGYNATGLRDEFQIDITTQQDGKPTNISEITDIPLNRPAVHKRQVKGNTFQSLIHFTSSEFKLMRIEQSCKVHDRSRSYDDASSGQTEDDFEREMISPVIWLSRSGLLLNKASGRIMTGSATAITGPDGRTDSAFRLSVALSCQNSAISAGTIMLWHKAGYTISGITLIPITAGVSGLWQFSYYKGAISSNLSLPAGDLFEFRMFSSSITTEALDDYCDNVVNHSGDVYLP